MHNYSPCQKRRRCETRKGSGSLRNLYFCGVHITATSGIAVHHAAPSSKCALVGVYFSCRQWMTPNDTYREPRCHRFVLEGVSFSRRSFREGPYPAWSSRAVYASLSSFPDDRSMGHKELSLGGFPTQPCFTSVDPKLFYRIPTALPCSVIWILESAVDADYFFIRRKRWIISLWGQSSFIKALLMRSGQSWIAKLFADFLLITIESICQSLYI